MRYAQAVALSIDLLGYELEAIATSARAAKRQGYNDLTAEEHQRLIDITGALTALGRSGVQREAAAMLAPRRVLVETTAEPAPAQPIDYAEADFAAAGEG